MPPPYQRVSQPNDISHIEIRSILVPRALLTRGQPGIRSIFIMQTCLLINSNLYVQVDFMIVFYQPVCGNGICLEPFEFNNLIQ